MKKSYSYIDGSYNPETKKYGCGGFLIDQKGEKHTIMRSGKVSSMANMRNVGGEILGAVEAIKMAIALGMKTVTIFHDYEGISKWADGEWKCNKKDTQKYAKFVNDARSKGLNVKFKHVKGHSGVAGNEEADKLAKMAVGLIKKEKKI